MLSTPTGDFGDFQGMDVRMVPVYLLGGFAFLATLMHFASIALAWKRCRKPGNMVQVPASAPGVTIVRPLCGLDANERQTLESGFALDYPDYELIFCVARAEDPAVPFVQALMKRHPGVPASLLVGDVDISANPKLNNCVRGWEAARHGWIILSDSNVLLPRDFIQRLLVRWQPDSGLVCAAPVGGRAAGFWAHLEGVWLNSFEARWQYAAERAGLGFAQGKTMLWRRDILDRAGGIRALASEIAEDAAATKVVHAQGLRVHLAEGPFMQPLGQRTLAQVWSRQLRWARLRRVTFPLFFVPELFAGSFFPVLAAGLAAGLSGRFGLGMALGVAGLWAAGEALLARAAGWQIGWAFLPCLLLRDLALPVLWVGAWAGNGFIWRGNQMSVKEREEQAGTI